MRHHAVCVNKGCKLTCKQGLQLDLLASNRRSTQLILSLYLITNHTTLIYTNERIQQVEYGQCEYGQ